MLINIRSVILNGKHRLVKAFQNTPVVVESVAIRHLKYNNEQLR